MTPETKYKLSALAYFFVLFSGFVLQFIFPYQLDPQTTTGAPHLTDNLLIIPVLVLATLVFALQVKFYFAVRDKVKFLPLIGAALILVLLVYTHWTSRAQNLDAETAQKIIELLQHKHPKS